MQQIKLLKMHILSNKITKKLKLTAKFMEDERWRNKKDKEMIYLAFMFCNMILVNFHLFISVIIK